MSLSTKIESLLFVSPRPLTVKRLAELAGADAAAVETELQTLAERYNTDSSGLHLLRHASSVQFVSSPLNSKLITDFIKEEQAGELTRPALETLTIVAYRGPISKIQLDTIRGVNCALILRNLMIKGLVEAKAAGKDKHQTSYQVTMDFVRFLGLNHIAELPDYEQLNRDENLEQFLNPTATVVQHEQGAVEKSTTDGHSEN
jgi:segregation and condensation protein B